MKHGLNGHMTIIESYLNEYKSPTTDDRSRISNIMFKYIIGSCFKKMRRRAFCWRSTLLIHRLTLMGEAMTGKEKPRFASEIIAKPDLKLVNLLRTDIGGGRHLFDWLATFHPSKDAEVLTNLFTEFLTVAKRDSGRQFQFIAPIFLDILISSLYAYLCLMKRLEDGVRLETIERIEKHIGEFSNAVRLLYLVTHSNAMKMYFAFGKHSLLDRQFLPRSIYTDFSSSGYEVEKAMQKIYEKHLWEWETPKDKDEPEKQKENKDRQEEEGSEQEEDVIEQEEEGSEQESIFRRSFMSFVDHYASLCLLEKRSVYFPANESIELSLMAATHSKGRYFPWVEMEKIIREMYKDKDGEGEVLISKIKTRLQKETFNDKDKVIKNFKTLLAHHSGNGITQRDLYPFFPSTIHCESFLAAVLCDYHDSQSLALCKLFEACPSSHYSSSSLTDL